MFQLEARLMIWFLFICFLLYVTSVSHFILKELLESNEGQICLSK